MRARLAGGDPVQRLTPPLQADLAEDRLRYPLAGLGNLQIEGVEGEQVPPIRRRREQSGQKPVVIVAPHLGGAEGNRLGHGRGE